MQLKKERDQLQTQVNAFENEKELTGIKYKIINKFCLKKNFSNELIQMLKKSQKSLEDANNQLMVQLQEAKNREEEQQIIWKSEVDDLTDIMRMLKEQLMVQHPTDNGEN